MGEGGVTSCGMLGWWAGALSRWFRLPCVPLLGAGVRPNKSETQTGQSAGTAAAGSHGNA